MFEPTQMIVVVAVLLGLVLSGVHIAIALGVTACIGIYMMQPDIHVVTSFVSNTAYEAVRDYIFAVIPLFMLMGEFLAKCGAARDLFALVNRGTKWLPGRLGVATVFANAIFGFITGVSIAAAAAFSRIAWPEMKRFGYDRGFSLATIAASACLGMLIPPSVLMIVWGVLTEQAIGQIFMAGVIPGFIVVGLYALYIIVAARRNPALVGADRQATDPMTISFGHDEAEMKRVFRSTMLVVGLIVFVLGGIWFGLFTPTEGAGVGAAAALVLALAKGMKPKEILEVVLSVGRTAAPLLLLLVMAQLYSRVLSMTGITGAAKELFIGSGLGPFEILAIMVLIWFILGCIIDSVSIILLTVPVFAPVATAVGFDPLAFAIIGIIAIETGLLTPPFGILVFTVKAALQEENIKLGEIFRAAIPFWLCLLFAIVVIAVFPQTATWLPNLGR